MRACWLAPERSGRLTVDIQDMAARVQQQGWVTDAELKNSMNIRTIRAARTDAAAVIAAVAIHAADLAARPLAAGESNETC